MENHNLVEENSTNAFNELELIRFMVKSKASPIELTDFYVISKGFLELWNQSLGEFLGDGDLKNYVYQHIVDEVDNKVISTHIPQKLVDEYVDLIFEFMDTAGYVSENKIITQPTTIKFHDTVIERYIARFNEIKQNWQGNHKQFIYAILYDPEIIKINSKFTEKDWSEWKKTIVGKEISKAINDYDLYDLG